VAPADPVRLEHHSPSLKVMPFNATEGLVESNADFFAFHGHVVPPEAAPMIGCTIVIPVSRRSSPWLMGRAQCSNDEYAALIL
jgi:hypothetical protein